MKLRSVAIASIVIGGAAITLLASYIAVISHDFRIETQSPQRTYQVTFDGKAEARNSGTIEFSTERVKLTVLKAGKEYYVKDPFFGEGTLGLHFKAAYPVIEWINDFTIRMGGDLSSQPFHDEIRVLNETKETLGVVEIFYGRYERFLIFDFAPGTSLTLSASPQFSVNLPPASTVIYRATNLGTRQERMGTVEGRKRKTPSEGPIKTTIEITESSKQE